MFFHAVLVYIFCIVYIYIYIYIYITRNDILCISDRKYWNGYSRHVPWDGGRYPVSCHGARLSRLCKLFFQVPDDGRRYPTLSASRRVVHSSLRDGWLAVYDSNTYCQTISLPHSFIVFWWSPCGVRVRLG